MTESIWHDGKVLHGELDYAVEFNPSARPSAPIVDILATIEGENDGANWHWLVLLESGVVAYITGGCDYTGWDCQSNCETFEEPTVELAVRQIAEAYRDEIVAQLPEATRRRIAGVDH